MLEKFFEQHNIAYERLSQKDCYAIQKKWRGIYCAQMKKVRGTLRTHNQRHDWYTFEMNFAVCKYGPSAWDYYYNIQWSDTPLYLIHETRKDEGWICHPEKLPDLWGTCWPDLYIFPEDMIWTMVFGSESQSGSPYFARKEWQ
ncbi:MAG: hypothetical protein ACYSUT_10890 [Planctomycetota bacterium]